MIDDGNLFDYKESSRKKVCVKSRVSHWGEPARETRFLEDGERQRRYWRRYCEGNEALRSFCSDPLFDWSEPVPRIFGPEEVAVLSPQFPSPTAADGGVQRTFNILWTLIQGIRSFGFILDLRPSHKVCLAPGAWHKPGISWVVLKDCFDENMNVERLMGRPTNPAAVLAFIIDRAREIGSTRPHQGFNLPGYLGFDPHVREYRLGLRFGFDSVYRRYVLAAVEPEEVDIRFAYLLPASTKIIR